MKKLYVYSGYFLFTVTAWVLASCHKDHVTPGPMVSLSADNITGESGEQITVTLNAASVSGVKALLITKNVNLIVDSSYGQDGVLEVTPSGTGDTMQYNFTYTLDPGEVNKLVGFLFRVQDGNGRITEKDLTVNTTVSPRQLLTLYRWNLKSKFHVNANAEEISDCESDDSYVFNWDGTMAIGYGTKACTFDGLNVYTGWTLSDDAKTLTITYASVFNPDQVTVETYSVVQLSKDKLVIDITLDLTIFGLTDHEVYRYTYLPTPR